MSRPRLRTLRPRLATLDTQRVQTLPLNPDATPRQRGRAWMERRGRWLREHPLCAHCAAQGRVTAAREVDHVIPLADGGADHEGNFQSLCSDCHAAKTAREATQRARGDADA